MLYIASGYVVVLGTGRRVESTPHIGDMFSRMECDGIRVRVYCDMLRDPEHVPAEGEITLEKLEGRKEILLAGITLFPPRTALMGLAVMLRTGISGPNRNSQRTVEGHLGAREF